MNSIKQGLFSGTAWFLIIILTYLTVSCRYYYTYDRDTKPTIEKLDLLKNSPNYMIVHQADQALNLKNIRVDNQAQTISGTLVELTPDHRKYLETKPWPGSSNRYQKKSSKVGLCCFGWTAQRY